MALSANMFLSVISTCETVNHTKITKKDAAAHRKISLSEIWPAMSKSTTMTLYMQVTDGT